MHLKPLRTSLAQKGITRLIESMRSRPPRVTPKADSRVQRFSFTQKQRK